MRRGDTCRVLAGTRESALQAVLATSQSPARAYLTRSAPSNQVWTTSHLSPPFDRKSRRGDRASCSSKKNFRDSLPVASPGAIRCLLIHWSHSRISKRFACSCFIIARPTSHRGGAQFKQKDFKTVFRDDESRGYLHRDGAAADLLGKIPIGGGFELRLFFNFNAATIMGRCWITFSRRCRGGRTCHARVFYCHFARR